MVSRPSQTWRRCGRGCTRSYARTRRNPEFVHKSQSEGPCPPESQCKVGAVQCRDHSNRSNFSTNYGAQPCVVRDRGTRSMMDSPPASIRAWAQRLLACEAANKTASASDSPELLHVVEKFRSALTQFIGVDGFTALMRRAVALARKEVPSLQTAKVTPEGRLEGIEGLNNHAEAAIAITAHLLTLLVTFVGEPLTLRLISDVWPEQSHRETIGSEDPS